MEMEMEMEEEIIPEGDVDDAVEHGEDVVLDVDLLVDFMEKKLASTRGKPSHRYTIFRIADPSDSRAFWPNVVSIGLLQHGERRLDEIKWQYLDKVLSRSKNNLKMYTKEIENIVVEAVSCYSPEGMLESGRRDYVEILLVDGCFLINLFLQLDDRWVDENDPIYNTDRWTLPSVARDMLLLENQLPFFVLEKLWELTGRERPALKTEVLRFFRNLLPEEHDLKLPETEDHVHHLLHLIHLSLRPSSSRKKPESTSGTTKNSSFESPKPLQPASPIEKSESASWGTIPSLPQPDSRCSSKSSPFQSTESWGFILCPELLPNDEYPIRSGLKQIPRDHQIEQMSEARTPPPPPPKTIPSATELQEAGLKQIPRGLEQIPRDHQIEQMSEARTAPPPPPKTIPSATELQEAGVKLQRRRAKSFLDVTFDQGLMQIPRLTISDSTNSLLRNFIAFEQGFLDCDDHFTSYCIFMDSLINTPRDVAILKQAGIIEHVLGSDEEVAFLFNKLCWGITWDFKNSYLAGVFEEVNQHTQKRWPKWRAKLVRDYFSNPWAILSVIAAIVILILTFLQTYFAVFAYFRPP